MASNFTGERHFSTHPKILKFFDNDKVPLSKYGSFFFETYLFLHYSIYFFISNAGLPPFMTGEEITNTEDYLAMATYLTQVYDTFRGEIPHIKHPKLVSLFLQILWK